MEKIPKSKEPLYLPDKGITGPSVCQLKSDKSTLKGRNVFLARRALNNNTVCPVKAATGSDV